VEKLWTCEQIAERYSVTVKTVWDWIKAKKLPAIKVAGSLYRIHPEDLDVFESQNKTMPETKTADKQPAA